MAVASLSELKLLDFSGGLNLLAAPSELAPNESPEMMNMTLDQRGGLVKRLGYTKDGSMSAFAADCANLFYSQVLGQLVVQEGVNVRKRTAAGTFSLVKAFSTSARVTFADFVTTGPASRLFMLHPVDGLFSYDGATVSGPHGTVKGVAMIAWQNKLWIAQGSAATPGSRVLFSVPGNGTDFAGSGSGSNDIRDVDDAPLVALTVSARGGLVAFKQTSSYRVLDSSNGSYVTIDPDTGAAGALAVASFEGMVAVLNQGGIYLTDGLSPLAEVSRRVSPLFAPVQLDLTNLDKFCASVLPNGTFIFSLRRTGATVNDLTLHYDPRVGWIVPYDFGASAFAVLGGSSNLLYHTAPGSARLLYQTFKGGSDDGTAIAARWQSRWFEPTAGTRISLRRCRLSGIGAFTLALKRDYELGAGSAHSVAILPSGFVWGTGVWGTGVWGPDRYEGVDDFWPRAPLKALALGVSESSSTSRTGQQPLGGGAAPEVGAFACYGLLLDYLPLGLS